MSLTLNAPNPFGATTALDMILARESSISIDVFDVSGRRVRHIASMPALQGRSRIVFDGRDQSGSPLASGAYFFRVTSNGGQVTRKIMILR